MKRMNVRDPVDANFSGFLASFEDLLAVGEAEVDSKRSLGVRSLARPSVILAQWRRKTK
jgi:hypothetical protein